MAIAASMSGEEENDGHENDLVMPGFRFHPTEEELIDFYLRRKVEGKHFNVELITYVDLYRHDPWELPAFAPIGEKEWFFYVPRDRKYRNGDRPNRVTTSGYWKATGADRIIRSENSRPIGLKKTLVFYAGKAPKGIRTCWIMNEYRLPHDEAQKYQKTEISVCRVYKRGGAEDRPPSSSKAKKPSEKCRKDSREAVNAAALPVQESIMLTSKIHAGSMKRSNMEASHFTVRTLLKDPTSSVKRQEAIIPTVSPLPNSWTGELCNMQRRFLDQGNYGVSLGQLPGTVSSVPADPMAVISEKPWEWNHPIHDV